MRVKKIGLIRILVILTGVVLLSGCIEEAEEVGEEARTLSPPEQAKSGCMELCESELAKGRDLSDGPCLSNNITEDWVCDVAYSPRQPVDNIKENQCSAFGRTAHHFVEVDPECNFIKAV